MFWFAGGGERKELWSPYELFECLLETLLIWGLNHPHIHPLLQTWQRLTEVKWFIQGHVFSKHLLSSYNVQGRPLGSMRVPKMCLCGCASHLTMGVCSRSKLGASIHSVLWPLALESPKELTNTSLAKHFLALSLRTCVLSVNLEVKWSCNFCCRDLLEKFQKGGMCHLLVERSIALLCVRLGKEPLWGVVN